MRAIAEEGRGAVVLLRDMQADAISARLNGAGAGSSAALRQYGMGAQILSALGVREMVLLTNSPRPNPVALEGYGLSIAETRPILSED